MMEVRDLYKTFDLNIPIENLVLRGLSLTIESGQFIVVIRSNGAGQFCKKGQRS